MNNNNDSYKKISVQDTPMPNLADIYPQVNNETSIFDNQNYPTLDLLTVEVVRDQQIPNLVNVSDVTSRRKRLAQRQNHKDKCEMKKSFISLKELNLEGVIIYPTFIETVDCSGNCHKHRVL